MSVSTFVQYSKISTEKRSHAPLHLLELADEQGAAAARDAEEDSAPKWKSVVSDPAPAPRQRGGDARQVVFDDMRPHGARTEVFKIKKAQGELFARASVEVECNNTECEVTVVIKSAHQYEGGINEEFEYTIEFANPESERTFYFGSWAADTLQVTVRVTDFSDITLRVDFGMRVMLKDDAFQPWRIMQRYNYSLDAAEMLQRWFFENSRCFPCLDEDEYNPVMRCCTVPSRGNPKLLDILLKNYSKHFDINQTDSRGRSSLHMACEYPFLQFRQPSYDRIVSVVCLLLSQGAKVNIHDKLGDTPLHIAAMSDRSEADSRVCRELVKAGAPIDAVNGKHFTPYQSSRSVAYGFNGRAIADEASAPVAKLDVSFIASQKRKPIPRSVPNEYVLLKKHTHSVTHELLTDSQLQQLFNHIDEQECGKVAVADLKRHLKKKCGNIGVGPVDSIAPSLERYAPGATELTYDQFALVMLSIAHR